MCSKKDGNWYYGSRNKIAFDRGISSSYLFYNIATIINNNVKKHTSVIEHEKRQAGSDMKASSIVDSFYRAKRCCAN